MDNLLLNKFLFIELEFYMLNQYFFHYKIINVLKMKKDNFNY